jgi:hypothetical protein
MRKATSIGHESITLVDAGAAGAHIHAAICAFANSRSVEGVSLCAPSVLNAAESRGGSHESPRFIYVFRRSVAP